MKIIGAIDDDNLIMQVSVTELAKITGFGNAYELKRAEPLKANKEYDVHAIWSAVHYARQRPETLKGMANTLLGLATQLGDMTSLAKRLVEPENNNGQS